MRFSVVVSPRLATQSSPYQLPSTAVVDRLGWHCYGGCREARITVPQTDTVQELFTLLRCPLSIYDMFGKLVWWGYIHEVSVPVGAWRISVSVADMTNRVAVAYMYTEPGTNTAGQRRTTGWAEDTVSQAEFGIREMLISQGEMTDTVAVQLRNTYLATHKYPLASYDFSARNNAEIICRGWWDTLAWRLAGVPTVSAISQTANTTNLAMGNSATNTMYSQQFTVGVQNINVLQVALTCYKTGAPTDNLTVGIYALDSGGVPTGSALTSATLAGSSLTTSSARYVLTMTEKELQAGTKYGLRVSRSGSVDGSNYYQLNATTDVYAANDLYRYNGSSWSAVSNDLTFEILSNNKVETSEQIRNLLVNYGQFLSTVHIHNSSGVATASYRDGETNAQREVEALMKTGTANNRQLLAEVLPDRQVRIYEEPAEMPQYQFDASGKLYQINGGIVDLWNPPVGNWVEFRNILSGAVDTTRMINARTAFLAGATWTNQGKVGSLRPEFRDQLTARDLAEVFNA